MRNNRWGRGVRVMGWWLTLLLAPGNAAADDLTVKAVQNPSPMVENTRLHTRLKEERPPGTRVPLRIGTLFVPEKLKVGSAVFFHFHGGTWLAEVAAAKVGAAVVTVQLGAGSSSYSKPFTNRKVFTELLQEAESKAGRKFPVVGLTAWSAGYGSVRAILNGPEHYERIQFVVLLDGLHAGYLSGRPGPKESSLVADDLAVFVRFAKDAALEKKRFLLTHTEIFPGHFASTTETADYVLKQLDAKRTPILRWGPLGTQILSEVRQGGFHLLGFAGNSAPDHVDLLHLLPALLMDVVSPYSSVPTQCR